MPDTPSTSFFARLRSLSEVARLLAEAHDLSTFFHTVVKHASERLGFSRISVWLYEEKDTLLRGTWGINECGLLRNEQAEVIDVIATGTNDPFWLESNPIKRQLGYPLYNQKMEIVGKGDILVSGFGDGQVGKGLMFVDNLISKKKFTEEDEEIGRASCRERV